MKKFLLVIVFLIFSSTYIFAQTYTHTGKITPIMLTNPLSFNGTYEVDRLIIRNGDALLLDSDNGYDVYDDKGVATINLKVSNDQVAIDLIYKMQMVGPAFKRAEITNYSFLYDSQTFTAKRAQNQPLSKALSSIGMTVYDNEDLLWEMPFENGYTVILKLEKKSDISIIIDKQPFIYVEK